MFIYDPCAKRHCCLCAKNSPDQLWNYRPGEALGAHAVTSIGTANTEYDAGSILQFELMFIPLLAFLGAVVVCIYLSVVWDAEASKLKSCGNLTKTATADYILNYIRVFFSRGDSRVLPTSASTSSEVRTTTQ